MNLSLIALSLGGCFLYVGSMSMLGRWLRICRETSSTVYIAPTVQRTIGA